MVVPVVGVNVVLETTVLPGVIFLLDTGGMVMVDWEVVAWDRALMADEETPVAGVGDGVGAGTNAFFPVPCHEFDIIGI